MMLTCMIIRHNSQVSKRANGLRSLAKRTSSVAPLLIMMLMWRDVMLGEIKGWGRILGSRLARIREIIDLFPNQFTILSRHLLDNFLQRVLKLFFHSHFVNTCGMGRWETQSAIDMTFNFPRVRECTFMLYIPNGMFLTFYVGIKRRILPRKIILRIHWLILPFHWGGGGKFPNPTTLSQMCVNT